MREHQKFFSVEDEAGEAAASLRQRLEHEGRFHGIDPAGQRTRASGQAVRRAVLLSGGPKAQAGRPGRRP